MKNINIGQYLQTQKEEYETIVSLIEDMENRGTNFVNYKGVSYNRTNIFGVLARIESRIEGAAFYNQNMQSNKWRKVHEVLLEKLAEQELEYHIEIDSVHNLTQSMKATEKVIREQGHLLPTEALNELKNSNNRIKKTIQYLREENKQKWLQDRFFELASVLEFEEGNKIYPMNLEDIENIHPLDIIVHGAVDLDVLKSSGHHKNVFKEKFSKIKEEALKETLLEDEREKDTA